MDIMNRARVWEMWERGLEVHRKYGTKPHVFMEFSGHVDWFEIRVFKDGWREDNTTPDFERRFDTHNEITLDGFCQVTDYLDSL